MNTPAIPPSPAAGAEFPGEHEAGLIEKVRGVIADELGKLFDRGKATVAEGHAPAGNPAKAHPLDIEGQVRKAVETVHAAEQAKAKGDEEKTSLKAEVERLKALKEAPPAEKRGWKDKMWDVKP